MGTGIFFKCITLGMAVCALVNPLALIATAQAEEREMLKKFGEDHARYMERAKRFIPLIV